MGLGFVGANKGHIEGAEARKHGLVQRQTPLPPRRRSPPGLPRLGPSGSFPFNKFSPTACSCRQFLPESRLWNRRVRQTASLATSRRRVGGGH